MYLFINLELKLKCGDCKALSMMCNFRKIPNYIKVTCMVQLCRCHVKLISDTVKSVPGIVSESNSIQMCQLAPLLIHSFANLIISIDLIFQNNFSIISFIKIENRKMEVSQYISKQMRSVG